MAPSKRRLWAIAIIILVLGAAALGSALTKFEMGQTTEPNLADNSTEPTQSPKTLNPTTTIPPPTSPTQTPPSTSTPVPTSTSPPTSSQAKSRNGSFELTISIEKTVYNVGEPVNITLAITNISNQTANFAYTGMDFDLIVQNGTDSLIYQWSIGRAFAMFIALKTPSATGKCISNICLAANLQHSINNRHLCLPGNLLHHWQKQFNLRITNRSRSNRDSQLLAIIPERFMMDLDSFNLDFRAYFQIIRAKFLILLFVFL